MAVAGSTGSHIDDKSEVSHLVLLEDGTEVEIPGEYPRQRIVVAGRGYVHVRDAQDGRWIYRAD